ncbi:type III polyketide synthase [Halobacillus campisalis]|uniref:Type III polyketide synthase n=1 Tax=Halobacillus campisalis TaxID=435909 RepID=A0ABW2K1M2_9BACI|nr:naringenin-chalcone synthase [Halobacillus campisalis]
MAFILSCAHHEADYNYKQEEIQNFIQETFPMDSLHKERLLPVFQNTEINNRQLAFPLQWYQTEKTLEEVNELYCEKAIEYSEKAIMNCLKNQVLLKRPISASEIDHIIFISSTGISTPTIDAYLMDKLDFSEQTKRTPLFGLGCAGGTSGVAKGYDYLKGAPDKNVLVVCVELCSLTFQHRDISVSNFVGSALFADGASAVLMAGEESELLKEKAESAPRVLGASTRTKPHSQSVMGWKVVNTGFEVIFKKSIPKLVRSFWKDHMKDCFLEYNVEPSEMPFIVAHPGGKKVIEAYIESLEIDTKALDYTKEVLSNHGNMSSPTVHFVLERIMVNNPPQGTKSFMTSLGPGFSSEIVSLEWA